MTPQNSHLTGSQPLKGQFAELVDRFAVVGDAASVACGMSPIFLTGAVSQSRVPTS